MYLRDEFNRRILEPAQKVEEKVDEETGLITFEELEGEYDGTRFVINPEYNSEQKYTPRLERPEWAPIGLLGKLVVIDDGTCEVNGYCGPGVNGVATARTDGTGYRVMARLDENHIKVLFK